MCAVGRYSEIYQARPSIPVPVRFRHFGPANRALVIFRTLRGGAQRSPHRDARRVDAQKARGQRMNIVAALRTPRAGAVEMPPRRRRAHLLKKEMRKDEKKTEFQLTDSITSSTIRTPALLRSENDQLRLGTGDRDQSKSPITNHLHRNKHGMQFLFAEIHAGLVFDARTRSRRTISCPSMWHTTGRT